MFVDAGKENEYHNMSTDGWKKLIATAQSGLDEFTGHFEAYVTTANRGNQQRWIWRIRLPSNQGQYSI